MKKREEARAFAPAHISCIFRTYQAEEYEKKGSLGLGFTLENGATASVARSGRTCITVNGREVPFETVREVIQHLTEQTVSVCITTGVPFGSGFGMSGASALATAYALNELLQLGLEPEALARVAHISEVQQGTGLGDVGGQYCGGISLRSEMGRPFHIRKILCEQHAIYFKVYGEIATSSIISDEQKKAAINAAGDRALARLLEKKDISFLEIMELSKNFALESGLLSSERVRNDIERIEEQGGKASMIMLGEAVFSTIPLPGYRQAILSTEGVRVL